MNFSINCGHTLSGMDSGAVGNGLKEQNVTRQVGNLVMTKLKAQGHSVTNCTVDSASSVSSALNSICAKSNAVKTDFFVSIHLNAFNSSAHGTEVFTYGAKEVKQARNMLNNIVALGYTNRGLKDGKGLAVLRGTKATAMLIELCFIDSKSDMSKFNADNMANAIVYGLTGQKVVITPTKQTSTTPTTTGTMYRVVTGSFTDRDNANKRIAELKAKGFESFIDLK